MNPSHQDPQERFTTRAEKIEQAVQHGYLNKDSANILFQEAAFEFDLAGARAFAQQGQIQYAGKAYENALRNWVYFLEEILPHLSLSEEYRTAFTSKIEQRLLETGNKIVYEKTRHDGKPQIYIDLTFNRGDRQ